MLSMLICHLCHTEIVLPANNVRFREPGKTGYVYFHDSDKRGGLNRSMQHHLI